jgi:hypothetical protein
VLPFPPSGGVATVVATLHTHAYGVQNIDSLVSIVLDPSFIGYARWYDVVLLTLKRYDITDDILSDAPPINDPASECMESVFLSWILNMIIGKLQDIAKEHGVTTHQI